MIEIKVLDEYMKVMFTAKVNDDWIHILTMRDLVKPFIKSTKQVPDGTGTDGKFKQLTVVYDGYYVFWKDFAVVGNEAN